MNTQSPLAAALPTGSRAVPSTPQKSMRIGILSALGTMDPRQAGDTITALVLEQIFESPYVVTPAGAVEPCLFADKLHLDRDGEEPVYSAAVRPGILFSDGTPLTAELAAASLAKTKALFGRARVTASQGRVVFTMSGQSPRFDSVLTQWNTAIVLERNGHLYGTGPYVLPRDSSMHGVNGVIRLERNRLWWRTAHIDELLFTIYPADADGTPARLAEAAKRGELDLTLNLSVNEVAKYGITGYLPMQLPSNSTSILYFNSQRPPLSDVALRRAIRSAIDTVRIAEINYERNHLAFTAADIIPPLMGRAIGTTAPRDRDQLRSYPNLPSRLTLVVPWTARPYILKPVPTAAEIASQLAPYGIRVEPIVTRNAEDFFSTLARGEYDLALAGWVADNPDPAEFYESLLHSAQVSTRGQYLSNLARWNRPEMDAALVAYRAKPTQENRKVIQDMIESEAILVPLVYGASTAIRSRKVKNVFITPANHLPFAEVDLS